MSFLRRLFGGGDERSPDGTASGGTTDADDGRSADEAEADHERENVRLEATRLDDLQQRQLRYADRAWTPPPQGGERRADDADAANEGC